MFKRRTVTGLADMICGNPEAGPFFVYRSSTYLTEFFEDAGTGHVHDGSTRRWWVAGVLEELLKAPWPGDRTPPPAFCRVIAALMDRADMAGEGEGPDRAGALAALNLLLAREGFKAFYGEDGVCHLRHAGSGAIAALGVTPHRPLSAEERRRRDLLDTYLDRASEDELIEDVLLPMFRQLGFERVRAAGHRNKALEYGKDIWMRFVLPTRHVLYFGVQTKTGTLDAAEASRGGAVTLTAAPLAVEGWGG